MHQEMLNLFCKLFNIVFESGMVPSSLTEGVICPFYKKGDANYLDNYRGITVLSCFIYSVLNVRLICYLESMNVLCEEWAGFRKGYSTMDHVLTPNAYLIYICIEISVYFLHSLTIRKHLTVSIA